VAAIQEVNMPLTFARSAAVLLSFPSLALHAQGAPTEAQAEFIKAAEEGAPARISSKAAVARLEPTGKLVPVRPGSNGFTCTLMPDESTAPLCADEPALRWFVAAVSKQPKPPAAAPGVAYMGKGGMHYETAAGEIVMSKSAGTKDVQEPPHWMLLTPLDPAATGIPARPNAGGSYIMFAGTPYAHLMVYQDPKLLKD
jgi:hypothetical protein